MAYCNPRLLSGSKGRRYLFGNIVGNTIKGIYLGTRDLFCTTSTVRHWKQAKEWEANFAKPPLERRCGDEDYQYVYDSAVTAAAAHLTTLAEAVAIAVIGPTAIAAWAAAEAIDLVGKGTWYRTVESAQVMDEILS